MSDKLHLLIPGAGAAPQGPLPPNLRALLALLAPSGAIEVDEDGPSSPAELATAQAIGLAGEAGRIPWAAHETGTYGVPCAWIVPCHWRVGADHVLLVPREELALDAATCAAFLAEVAPYFEEDGISLRALPAPHDAWLATGELFRDLATVSMDRAAMRRLTPETFGAGHKVLRRLQNEMQMLLYTHPANEAREARGLLPVNSFWVAGAGVLAQPIAPAPHVVVETALVTGRGGWAEVDAGSCARLLAVARAGGEARLTLCGDRAVRSFGPARTGALRRFLSDLGLQGAPSLPEQL